MDLVPSSWSPYTANTSYLSGRNLTDEETSSYLLKDGEEQLFQGYSPSLLTFASATCIVFILIGIPGNLITIIALARCKKVRNATAVFIINLSLSDLLFCCFNLPLAASTFWKRGWVHGELLCHLFPLMRYGLLAVSLFTVLAITINRYVMIGHPRIYPRIYRHRYLGIMVAATWICAFCALIPTWRGVWGAFGLDKDIGSCSILKDRNGTSPKEFLFVMAFVVPCISIVVCYARIFYIVRKTAMRSHEPILVSSSVRMIASAGGKLQKNNTQNDASHSDRQLLEKSSRTSKEENSENSSSLSNSSILPQQQMLVIPEIQHQGLQQVPQNSQQEPMQRISLQQIHTRNLDRPRPYLSKLREDEIKFIDTSVDSDFPPSLSALKEEPNEKSPDSNSNNSYSTAKTRTLNGSSHGNGNGSGHGTQIKINEVDSAVEDSTSSSDNNQVFHITSNSEVSNQLLSVQVEPSSSSGIDIPVDQESPPRRQPAFKKSFKASLRRVTKRQCRKVSTMNTSGASILYPGRMTQKDRRLLKMILVIFLSFLICYLPITITKIAKGATEIHIFNIMGYLLIYLTTCINPIIYVVMSSEYRQAYWNLLMCRTSVGRRNGQGAGPAGGGGCGVGGGAGIGASGRKNEMKFKNISNRT